MEARRPSNQAVDTREPDPRLKSAKTRSGRLRSLATRAACGVLVVIAAAVALPAQAQAQAQVLVSNIGQANFGGAHLYEFDLAQTFTTGSNSAGYTLTSVELDIEAAADHSTAFTVSLHSNNSGTPGANLGTLSNPTPISTNGVYAFTTRGIALAADTTYFVVIDTISDITDFYRFFTNEHEIGQPGSRERVWLEHRRREPVPRLGFERLLDVLWEFQEDSCQRHQQPHAGHARNPSSTLNRGDRGIKQQLGRRLARAGKRRTLRQILPAVPPREPVTLDQRTAKRHRQIRQHHRPGRRHHLRGTGTRQEQQRRQQLVAFGDRADQLRRRAPAPPETSPPPPTGRTGST